MIHEDEEKPSEKTRWAEEKQRPTGLPWNNINDLRVWPGGSIHFIYEKKWRHPSGAAWRPEIGLNAGENADGVDRLT